MVAILAGRRGGSGGGGGGAEGHSGTLLCTSVLLSTGVFVAVDSAFVILVSLVTSFLVTEFSNLLAMSF